MGSGFSKGVFSTSVFRPGLFLGGSVLLSGLFCLLLS